MKEGTSIREINREYTETFIRFHRGIEKSKFYFDLDKSRNWKTNCLILWGKPGSGKSHWANELAEQSGWRQYWKPKGEWWDGYDGEEMVIMDEFDGDMNFALFKNVVDRYRLVVPVKGGHVVFLARLLVITTNTDPQDWYQNTGQDLRSLTRRISTLRFQQCSRIHPEDREICRPVHKIHDPHYNPGRHLALSRLATSNHQRLASANECRE